MDYLKLASLFAVALIIASFIFYEANQKNLEKKAFLQKLNKTVKQFPSMKVNSCEIIMNKQNLSYALCTLRQDGIIALKTKELNCTAASTLPCSTNFITSFKPGEYLGLQVNLQKLDIPFEQYYACAYTNFPLFYTAYPPKYGNAKPKISYESFSCSPKLSLATYHNFAISGFVLKEKGEYIIMRIYAFNGSLPSDFDFKNNLKLGKVVFELKGSIE